jgi:hypothetical protein
MHVNEFEPLTSVTFTLLHPMSTCRPVFASHTRSTRMRCHIGALVSFTRTAQKASQSSRAFPWAAFDGCRGVATLGRLGGAREAGFMRGRVGYGTQTSRKGGFFGERKAVVR